MTNDHFHPRCKSHNGKPDPFAIKLKEFLNRDANVCFGIMFGSCVVGKQNKVNDIDIAVYFKKPPEGMELLLLINNLSDLVMKEVDMTVLNGSSAFLRHQVMKYGIPLTIKDRFIYTRFREKTIADYDEYKYISGLSIYDR